MLYLLVTDVIKFVMQQQFKPSKVLSTSAGFLDFQNFVITFNTDAVLKVC